MKLPTIQTERAIARIIAAAMVAAMEEAERQTLPQPRLFIASAHGVWLAADCTCASVEHGHEFGCPCYWQQVDPTGEFRADDQPYAG